MLLFCSRTNAFLNLSTTSKPSQNVEKMTSLTAQFVEPEHDRIDWGVTTPLPSGNSSIQYAISDGKAEPFLLPLGQYRFG